MNLPTSKLSDSILAAPDNIYSMAEAAKKLHISRQSLQGLIQRHLIYAANGRRKLFSDDDLAQLWQAMRMHSVHRAEADPKASPSDETLYARVRAFTSKGRDKAAVGSCRTRRIRRSRPSTSCPVPHGWREVEWARSPPSGCHSAPLGSAALPGKI